jgi:hypothetical protein
VVPFQMNVNATELARLAAQIPSMGGAKMPALREFAREAPGNTAIVEVGCWLGAGTAQLALGILERENKTDIRIHCYDRWEANEAEIEKAARSGLHLQIGENILPHMRRMLQPFGVPIDFHQGDIRQASWDGTPISVYVDDAAKTPKLFFHALKTFAPSWIPGQTVVILMDYFIWQKTGNEDHKCQKDFIESHSHSFERIPHPTRAIFLYRAPVAFENWIAAKGVANYSRQEDTATLVEEIRRLNQQLYKRDEQLRKKDEQLDKREKQIHQMQNSFSWRITAPLRWGADSARRFLPAVRARSSDPRSRAVD